MDIVLKESQAISDRQFGAGGGWGVQSTKAWEGWGGMRTCKEMHSNIIVLLTSAQILKVAAKLYFKDSVNLKTCRNFHFCNDLNTVSLL